MLQSTIILIFATITGLLGLVANIKAQTGLKSMFYFLTIYTIIVYFGDYQVRCFVTGGCNFTSWFAVMVLLVALYGIAYVYYTALQMKSGAAGNEAVVNANPVIKNALTYLENHYNISIQD